MAICYLGVGSNLGDRRKNIQAGLEKIEALKDTRILRTSKLIETAPCGGPKSQGKFLNGALKIKTGFTPVNLLKKLKQIEKELGRKKGRRWGPRPIDLDILFYDFKVINLKKLKIPHPRIFQREFVVRPLLEILY